MLAGPHLLMFLTSRAATQTILARVEACCHVHGAWERQAIVE